MPTIHRIGSFRITIYPRDHAPAHVHVLAPDFAVKVVIETGEVLPVAGAARGLDAVLMWIEANRPLLMRRWRETRSDP